MWRHLSVKSNLWNLLELQSWVQVQARPWEEHDVSVRPPLNYLTYRCLITCQPWVSASSLALPLPIQPRYGLADTSDQAGGERGPTAKVLECTARSDPARYEVEVGILTAGALLTPTSLLSVRRSCSLWWRERLHCRDRVFRSVHKSHFIMLGSSAATTSCTRIAAKLVTSEEFLWSILKGSLPKSEFRPLYMRDFLELGQWQTADRIHCSVIAAVITGSANVLLRSTRLLRLSLVAIFGVVRADMACSVKNGAQSDKRNTTHVYGGMSL